MTEHTEVINLGLHVADAERPELHLAGQRLVLTYVDWQEQAISVEFSDVIALRWQEADYFIDAEERFDSTHLVHESEWLGEHDRQNITWQHSGHRHLKLNFNAAGILEVLCTGVRLFP